MQPVQLGPYNALHTGLHGELMRTAPAGICYTEVGGEHRFATPSANLFSGPSAVEAVRFADPELPTHSAAWLVTDCAGWVIDFEDFGFPVFAGQFGLNPVFSQQEAKRATRSSSFTTVQATRIENYSRGLAQDSCKRVFFNTEHERRKAVRWLRCLAPPKAVDTIVAKMDILPPSVQTLAIDAVEQKWVIPVCAPRIVFCGRGFECKRGEWTLEAFREALDLIPTCELTYIGDIPEWAHRQYADVLRRITVIDREIPRADVLSLFANAHLLFHPAENESVGSVILEAAASGMCVITASGDGMEQMDEWFSPLTEFFVDRRRVDPAHERLHFARILQWALRTPERVRAEARRLYQITAAGPLSLRRRDAVLCDAYAECADSRSGPLRWSEFVVPDGFVVSTHSTSRLLRLRSAIRQAFGAPSRSYDFSYEP